MLLLTSNLLGSLDVVSNIFSTTRIVYDFPRPTSPPPESASLTARQSEPVHNRTHPGYRSVRWAKVEGSLRLDLPIGAFRAPNKPATTRQDTANPAVVRTRAQDSAAGSRQVPWIRGLCKR